MGPIPNPYSGRGPEPATIALGQVYRVEVANHLPKNLQRVLLVATRASTVTLCTDKGAPYRIRPRSKLLPKRSVLTRICLGIIDQGVARIVTYVMKHTPWYEQLVYRPGNEPKSMLLWLMVPILMAILHILIRNSFDYNLLVVAFIGIIFLGVERWAFAKTLESRDREIARLKKLS